MLKLTHYQSIFNEDNAELRCRRVLDEISPIVQALFEQFVEKIDVPLGDEFFIKSYDSTLSTASADARNPKYSEQKKASEIGRKYFVGLYRKQGNREYNLLTIEFNGMNNSLYVHVDMSSSFMSFWAWLRNNQMEKVLQSIPGNFSIFTGWTERILIDKNKFVPFFKSCLKPRKRPLIHIGISQPLQGELDEAALIEQLTDAWQQFEEFRAYFYEEMDISKRAYMP